MKRKINIYLFGGLLALAMVSISGCKQAVNKASKEQNVAFSYDRAALKETKPWSSEQFLNNPVNFQFAVLGDRTGGSDPRGIFDRAIDQLNLLQPEFVINVGDLVEGYTKDKDTARAMWDEVDPMIEKLDMPFFYTVGNHDMGNETMREVWMERHGTDYYYFIYQDVLFLVMNSEDPSNPIPDNVGELTKEYKKLQQEDPEAAKAMLGEFMASLDSYRKPFVMSDKQINYFKQVVADHPDVRWTFAFFHQPDWDNPGEGEAFKAIEEMLQGRPYTVIAGHLHYYDYKQRHGRDYITMGPAGASWHQNGGGNVDHFLWITMKEDGPEIAKITMDGIYDRQGRDIQLKEMYDRHQGD